MSNDPTSRSTLSSSSSTGTGIEVRSRGMTEPSSRNGPPSLSGSRLTYCSPTALRLATVAVAPAGIGSTSGSMVISTRTPSSMSSMSLTRPTATPR